MHTEKKVKWAIFCSGWGRSASTLIALFEENRFHNAMVDTIVCTGQNTLFTKDNYQSNYHIINDNPAHYSTRIEWQQAIKSILQGRGIDFIFLCGFKYRIHSPLLEEYPNRILNIHPSLLPAFKNTQRAIQEAIDLKVKVTGITTHIIDDHIDEGTIICQEPIRIEDLEFKEVDEKFTQVCPEILEKTIQKILAFHYEKIVALLGICLG